ncbi:MAG: proprotein convertase P-domain-containing protein [Chitinophagales bacterium]
MKNFLLSILLFAGSLLRAAPGDDCSTAILVSSNGCSATGAYDNTGVSGTLTPPTCFTTGNNNGMWFYFVASSTTAVVTVNGGTLTLPQMALLTPPTGGCSGSGAFTIISCTSPGTSSATIASYGGLTVGNTYYVYVDGQNNTTGTFQLCVSSPLPATNDDPCTAITPPSISNWCSPPGAYTTSGSTPDIIPACFDATGGSQNVRTVWFKFVATQIGVTLTVSGVSGGIQPQVALYTLTPCSSSTYTPIGCVQAATGSNSVTLNNNFLVPGTTYYIAVDAVGNNDGPFSICIDNHPVTSTVVNDGCTGAIALCPNQHYFATTAGATSANDVDISNWLCNGDLNNAIWFKFTATTPPQDVSFNVNWTTHQGGYLQFEPFEYTGTGSPCSGSFVSDWLSLIDNIFDPPCGNASSGTGVETIPASFLTAGKTYYVLVDNFPDDTVDFDFTTTGIAGTEAGPDQTVCSNAAAFNLSGATPAGGTWSGTGITNASLGTFNPGAVLPGQYVVYYTANGCTDYRTITVQGPKVTCSSDVSICAGQSVNISGTITEYPTSVNTTFSNTTAVSIPDNNTTGISSVVTVSGINPTTVATNPIVSVCVDITHTYADDLRIRLRCPGGTTMTLLPVDNSFTSGDDLSGTCFVTGATSITTASPPYAGSFAPSQPFTNLNGCLVNGNWTLLVADLTSGDIGQLNNWSITFNNIIPAPTYLWSPTTNMVNSTSLSPTVTPPSTQDYILTATDINGCIGRDTVRVNVVSKPNAGTDKTISCVTSLPGGSVAMTATGTGTWTALSSNPGTATITSNASPTTTITSFSALGTYGFVWGSGSCVDTVFVTVTGGINAGSDQTISCVTSYPGGTATMAATGTGTWTAMASNPGTATITANTSPTTTITTFSVAGTYNFIWTNGSGCKDTVQIAISSKPNAGTNQTVSCVGTFPGGTATMAATGTGTWTAMASNPGTATITANTSPTTTITTFSVAGIINFIWTNGSCSDTAGYCNCKTECWRRSEYQLYRDFPRRNGDDGGNGYRNMDGHGL